MQTTSESGCGSGSCGCRSANVTEASSAAGAMAKTQLSISSKPPIAITSKRINGVTLGSAAPEDTDLDWLELAHTELLRQEAVKAGLLPATTTLVAPALTAQEQLVIESMVDEAVRTPEPTPQECERYFEANKSQFVTGQALHVRHILFAVTPGVNVNSLAGHAEKALLSLQGKNVAENQFQRLAGELSNCPTGANGGDLGWISPDDCVPELSKELFRQKEAQWGLGVHPRLVHSRFGLHIMEILERSVGQQKSFEEVRERISAQLVLQSRAKALHQYMRLLVGKAEIAGIKMEGADSPLLQ
jgi:peptidyl-prolyl cis-trans isomerase C